MVEKKKSKMSFEILKLKFFIKLPFMIVITIIVCFYCNYLINHVLPNLRMEENTTNVYMITIEEKKSSIIIFHLLLLLVLMCLTRTVFSNPGIVPQDWNHNLFEKVYSNFIKYKTNCLIDISKSEVNFYNLLSLDIMKKVNVNNKEFKDFLDKNQIRFCKYCEMFKPNRAHHCRQCSKCILKMDHHCNWILNCIGFRNYKFFLQFIFYTSILIRYSPYFLHYRIFGKHSLERSDEKPFGRISLFF